MVLEKIATLYRKAEMGFISGLAGTTSCVIDEVSFYDVGYMQTQIERIKKELKRITDDLGVQVEVKDNSDYAKRHIAELMEQREQLLFHMVFLASNSFNNLDSCVNLSDGHDWEFLDCIRGLQAYRAGQKDIAFHQIEAYYRQHGKMEKHFLINKVFGLLLAEKGQYQKAISFLTYALQFVPDDTECLQKLKLCYQKVGNTGRASVVNEILAVLN